MDNPAAWHPDPTGRHEHRWWDGERWTEHVADAGQSSVDPIDTGTGSSTDAAGGAASMDSGAAADASSGDATAGTTGAAPDTTGGQASQPSTPAWEQPGGHDVAGTPGAGAQQQWQQPQQQWQQPQQGWPQSTPGTQAPPPTTPGLAVTALVLAILSLLFFWVPVLGGLGAVIAILFGFIGRSQAKKRGGSGAGLGISGIIVGAIALLLNILVTLALFGLFGSFGGWITDYTECMDQYNDAEFCDQQLEDQLFRRFGGR